MYIVHKMFALPEINFKQKHSLSACFCCVLLCSLHLILECFHLKICFTTETDTFGELMCLYFTTFVDGFHFKRRIWWDSIFSIQLQAFEFIENFTFISNVIVNNIFGENDQNCSLFVVRLLKSPQASIYCLSRNVICCIECVSWHHIPISNVKNSFASSNVLFSWCQLFTIVNTISMDFQHNTKANFVSFIALCMHKYRIAKANLVFWGENGNKHKTKETTSTIKNPITDTTETANKPAQPETIYQWMNIWTFHFVFGTLFRKYLHGFV